MKLSALLVTFVAAAGLCQAQRFEFGAVSGAGFLSNVGASGTAGTAITGFQTGVGAGGFISEQLNRHLSGELRYMFLPSDLHIQSHGSEAAFSGQQHVLHYDILWHFARPRAKREFFIAVGGGMKLFRGTGQEQAYQPLMQYGYFTRTQVIKPVASFGAGMKYAVTPRLVLRAEFRDYVTPFPTDLIAPAPGQKFGSILQNLVPMMGISYTFGNYGSPEDPVQLVGRAN
jgi:hypothetical protein